MRVKLVGWATWAQNPDHGTAGCRECGKVVQGADFYEAETLDVKGRRFLCAECVEMGRYEVVADFGVGVAPAASHPMSELLPSHRKVIQGMILGSLSAAITAHEKKCHAGEEIVAEEKVDEAAIVGGKSKKEPASAPK